MAIVNKKKYKKILVIINGGLPIPYIKGGAIETLINIIRELGSTPIITTAKEHDEAVALISHMPMVIAQALVDRANYYGGSDNISVVILSE